ncbi:MAG: helix-turn-helix transcriptional regulator [Bacteroidaceae bacterium]
MISNIDMKVVGPNLKRIRLDHSLSQYDMARITGISRQAYSKIENGVNNLTLQVVIPLAKHYGVTIEELLLLPLRTSSNINVCRFETYEQNKDGTFKENGLKILDNLKNTVFLVKSDTDTSFYECTSNPIYGQEMLFYYNSKIIQAKIYKATDTKYCFIDSDNKANTVNKKSISFIGVKTSIFESIK